MEVRPGYKQTEVGVIPSEWNEKLLHEGVKLLSGHHVLAQHCNTQGKGTPYITGPSDFANGYIEHSKFTEKPTTICRKDDILITVKGSGAGTLVLSDSEYCISRQLMAIRVTEWDTGYVYSCLRSDAALFITAATGLIPGLSRGNILNKRILIPLLPEQRAIATALSDVDALLAKLDQFIGKKRDLKQAAMQQLLTGQTRLPGFSGQWEVKRLGDIGDCLRGVTYKGDGDLWPHDTARTKRLLRSNNVQNATVVLEDIQFVNSDRVSALQLLRRNDILICMANGSKALVGKAGLFSVSDGYDYTFGAFMGCFRSNTAASSSSFVFYLFQTGRYRNYINNLLAGSSINNLSPGSIESLEFQIPSLPEQTAIAAILSDMDNELTALETRRDKTRALKQGMMQELLAGRIRLV